jgi:iron complex outermembrane receptor protein
VGIEAAITRGWVAGTGVAYEHSRYDKYRGFAGFERAAAGNTQVALDASGNQMQRAPEWVIAATTDYTRAVSSNAQFTGHVGWYFNGGFFWEAGNQLKQRPYNLIDASVSYSMNSDAFSVKLWGTNLTNQFYYTSELLSNFGTGVQYAPPRMFGLSFTWRQH